MKVQAFDLIKQIAFYLFKVTSEEVRHNWLAIVLGFFCTGLISLVFVLFRLLKEQKNKINDLRYQEIKEKKVENFNFGELSKEQKVRLFKALSEDLAKGKQHNDEENVIDNLLDDEELNIDPRTELLSSPSNNCDRARPINPAPGFYRVSPISQDVSENKKNKRKIDGRNSRLE
eukprot:TRINITY_DN1833_c0_g1_i1.p1 TRINITY_DN1833_c0_g1~~TRINITY_DN1833_c0_g1_i1.p1  ORF type:complete len:174 (+),score=62.58 TRINITY_DN1833_c0_g1_i1:32-553(+)